MTHGMVSAPQPEAVEAGIDVLASGGNALDAAIGCALVQSAVDPQMCGIAGFGALHIYMPGRNIHQVLNFHGRAPKRARPDMWEHLIVGETEDGFGFILKDHVNELGYESITTPMTLRAFDTALSRCGSRSLAELIEPAIGYCNDGFVIRPAVTHYWNESATKGRVLHRKLLTEVSGTAKVYTKPDGSLYSLGETLKNPDMGRTYARIAEHGVDDFYTGAIADEIVADMEANGGLIRHDDLADIAVTTTEPLWGTYRGHRIATNTPPGGGIMLLEMLNILENFDLAGMGHNSADAIATIAEAMKIATTDKDTHVGDPNFIDVPVERLTSKAYAEECAARIKSGEKASVTRLNPGGIESKHTTQVTAVDEHGNCVTMTHSLGMPSGVVSDGLGFMYNGCMGVFDPRPGRAGSLAPGKSRFSAMCPTIVFKGDAPFFAVGAPGGTQITMGVLQSILNAVDYGMDAQQAVAAPRISATSNTIELSNRVLRRTQAELDARGYSTRRMPSSYMFASPHAIRIVDGKLDGGADPGRDGMAIAV